LTVLGDNRLRGEREKEGSEKSGGTESGAKRKRKVGWEGERGARKGGS